MVITPTGVLTGVLTGPHTGDMPNRPSPTPATPTPARTCWCGQPATVAQPCDLYVTPGPYVTTPDGQPATVKCDEHCTDSGWLLDGPTGAAIMPWAGLDPWTA